MLIIIQQWPKPKFMNGEAIAVHCELITDETPTGADLGGVRWVRTKPPFC